MSMSTQPLPLAAVVVGIGVIGFVGIVLVMESLFRQMIAGIGRTNIPSDNRGE